MQNCDEALPKNSTTAPAFPTINSGTALTDTDCSSIYSPIQLTVINVLAVCTITAVFVRPFLWCTNVRGQLVKMLIILLNHMVYFDQVMQ